jgi:hypothetical protein
VKKMENKGRKKHIHDKVVLVTRLVEPMHYSSDCPHHKLSKIERSKLGIIRRLVDSIVPHAPRLE